MFLRAIFLSREILFGSFCKNLVEAWNQQSRQEAEFNFWKVKGRKAYHWKCSSFWRFFKHRGGEAMIKKKKKNWHRDRLMKMWCASDWLVCFEFLRLYSTFFLFFVFCLLCWVFIVAHRFYSWRCKGILVLQHCCLICPRACGISVPGKGIQPCPLH